MESSLRLTSRTVRAAIEPIEGIMGATIEELYFETLPVDLFRHGSATSPQMTKPRTMPPRKIDEVHDIRVYDKSGELWVHHDSGGISLFNRPNARFGNRWWKLPKGSPIPIGLRVSRDQGMNPATGQIHYTVRPAYDMPLSRFVQSLGALSTRAVPEFAIAQRKA